MREKQKMTVGKQKAAGDYTKIKMILFGALAAGVILTAVFAPYLVPYDPYEQDLGNALLPPGGAHLLGTDRYGRDMLSRVIMGSRTTVFAALLLVAVITVIGSAAGILCGYHGGKLDAFLMRVSDIFLAFPGMVFAIAVASVMSGGILNAVIALACISWPKYARIARSQVLSIRNMPYMAAAKLSGSGTLKMICRHVVPNIAGPVIDGRAGYRNDDDGDRRPVLSGTGRCAAHCRMGFHDEQRKEHAADFAVGYSGAGYGHFSDGSDL